MVHRTLTYDTLSDVGRWSVEITDARFVPQGALNDWANLEFIERLCDVGSGKLDCSASEWHRSLIVRGAHVVVKCAGVVVSAGPIVRFGEERDAESGTIKVDWSDQLSWLAGRAAYPDPDNYASAQAVAHDSRSGPTSTVVAGFIAANAGPEALPLRAVPGLTIGDDPGGGLFLQADVQARFDNLLELCRSWALAGGVGFRITTDDRVHTLRLWVCRDLTEFTQWASPQPGRVSWSLTAPTATTVVAGGKGELLARALLEVDSFESRALLAQWGRRVEFFHDQRNAEAPELEQSAFRVLAERGETVAVSFEAAHTTLIPWQDFHLGDVVTVSLRPGLSVAKPIKQVTWRVGSDGVRILPLIGDVQASSGLPGEQMTRDLVRAVGALQRNR